MKVAGGVPIEISPKISLVRGQIHRGTLLDPGSSQQEQSNNGCQSHESILMSGTPQAVQVKDLLGGLRACAESLKRQRTRSPPGIRRGGPSVIAGITSDKQLTDQLKVTTAAVEKFDTPPTSRYHSWKTQVEPGTTCWEIGPGM